MARVYSPAGTEQWFRAPKPPVTNDAVRKLVKELDSSDTAVRDAAVKALTTITGQTFGTDVKKWKEWWKEQKPETTTAAGTPVEVLQADATAVRLHGACWRAAPKGIFLLGKETNGTETSTTRTGREQDAGAG